LRCVAWRQRGAQAQDAGHAPMGRICYWRGPLPWRAAAKLIDVPLRAAPWFVN
jgi:hypothetical protein